jgi:hypothetical protein
LLRSGFSSAGLERLRQAALANRPWEHSTGPRTPEGKARAARNARVLQKGRQSVRELRADIAALLGVASDLEACRRLLQAGVFVPQTRPDGTRVSEVGVERGDGSSGTIAGACETTLPDGGVAADLPLLAPPTDEQLSDEGNDDTEPAEPEDRPDLRETTAGSSTYGRTEPSLRRTCAR